MLVGKRRRLLKYLQRQRHRPLPRADPGARPAPVIEPGAPAPDFTLPDQDGKQVSLADFRGQTVVLVFYPLDFSPVCTDQLNVYQEVARRAREPRRAAARHLGRLAPSATRRSRSTSASRSRCSPTSTRRARSPGLRRVVDEYGVSGRALVMIGPDGNRRVVVQVAAARVPRDRFDLSETRAFRNLRLGGSCLRVSNRGV